ncbi:hypothetical protein NKH77_20430 [Streptomyces sp. M19]
MVRDLLADHPDRLHWYVCRFCSDERGAAEQIPEVTRRSPFVFFDHVRAAGKSLVLGCAERGRHRGPLADDRREGVPGLGRDPVRRRPVRRPRAAAQDRPLRPGAARPRRQLRARHRFPARRADRRPGPGHPSRPRASVRTLLADGVGVLVERPDLAALGRAPPTGCCRASRSWRSAKWPRAGPSTHRCGSCERPNRRSARIHGRCRSRRCPLISAWAALSPSARPGPISRRD